MTGNILGERFVVLLFGESHGPGVGVVIDGCPAGLPIVAEEIQREVDLRRPGNTPVSSSRVEEDKVVIFSGIFREHTTGTPVAIMVWNKDVDSSPYEAMVHTPRPGHADYTGNVKYGGFQDYRGGGHFSARLTAPMVMAGAVAKKLLSYCLGVEIIAYSKEIGGVQAEGFSLDEARQQRYMNDVRAPNLSIAEKMRQRILEVKQEGDSVGGVVECQALNLPVGLGEPIFGALDSDLSRAFFSIPAVKGVGMGSGFDAAGLLGSEHNDAYAIQDGEIRAITNNAGGILGGLSGGMPIVAKVAFKPTSSIAKRQRTVDMETKQEVEITVPGRHDPCVVPRAVPVVESIMAIVLVDHALRGGFIPPVVSKR